MKTQNDSFNRGKVDFTKKCPSKGCLLCSGHPNEHQFKKTKATLAREQADSITEELYAFLERLETLHEAAVDRLLTNLEEVFETSAITGEDTKAGRYWTLNKLSASEGVREFLCAHYAIEGRTQSEIEAAAKKTSAG